MDYVNAFLIGGAICVVGQILVDLTKLTPARIMVLFVTLGVILDAVGIYQKVIDIGGAGATVPIVGFGHVLAKGVIKEVDTAGLLGAFTGGVKAAAGGIASAVFFGYIMALVSQPKAKS